MKVITQSFWRAFAVVSACVVFSLPVFAQQQVQRTQFDVSDYRMDVQLSPNENKLSAIVDVTFVPQAATRAVTFELNGSLAVESVARIGALPASTGPVTGPTPPAKPGVRTTPAAKPTPKQSGPAIPQATFIQDRVGVSDLGPNVKVDIGDNVAAGTPVTLRFKYSGVLVSAEGGPLLTKRLAYVGANSGYLMYAARWFPFNRYAADRATSDISISLPAGFTLTGFSDQPVVTTGGKSRFVSTKPALPGSFAYDRFQTKSLRFGEFEVQFNTKATNDAVVAAYGETLGRALDFYAKRYGMPNAGKKLVVAQIDDDSLEFYSAPGMIFVASRDFDAVRDPVAERLQREAAYQWFGFTVGLDSFDDAWLSQGLAEFSAFSLRESTLSGAKLDSLRRELLEKALTFEQTASIVRAPGNLDDQSTAYQYIMFDKGAMVYKLLRDTLGEQKFNQLMRSYVDRYRDKNTSIENFEKLASEIAGTPMRYFFARWVESTGVPEFTADYLIIRTRGGKFITRGTVRQNFDNLRLPVEIQLRSEGGDGTGKTVTVQMDESSADFNIETEGKPLELVIDPNYKVLRISDDLRVSSIARRGIEQFKEGNYAEAQAQFEAALKLDRSNAWVYYHLGLLFLQQRNYDNAKDNFKVVTGLGPDGSRPSWLYVWAWIKLGNAYDAQGDRTRAVDAYSKAAAVGDDYDNAQDAVQRYQATPYDPKEKAATAVKE